MLIIESNAHLDLKANAHIYLFIHSFIHYEHKCRKIIQLWLFIQYSVKFRLKE